jgi:hypothetical protein
MVGEHERAGKHYGGHNAQSDKNSAKAAAFAKKMRPLMAELKDLSANQAAIILNERGVPTAAGARWSSVQVIRVRRRLALAPVKGCARRP